MYWYNYDDAQELRKVKNFKKDVKFGKTISIIFILLIINTIKQGGHMKFILWAFLALTSLGLISTVSEARSFSGYRGGYSGYRGGYSGYRGGYYGGGYGYYPYSYGYTYPYTYNYNYAYPYSITPYTYSYPYNYNYVYPYTYPYTYVYPY